MVLKTEPNYARFSGLSIEFQTRVARTVDSVGFLKQIARLWGFTEARSVYLPCCSTTCLRVRKKQSLTAATDVKRLPARHEPRVLF